MKLHKRKCARWNCMKEFVPKNNKQKYCSSKCNGDANRERATKRNERIKNHHTKLERFYKRTT